MKSIQHFRLETQIREEYKSIIDLSDLNKNFTKEQLDNALLTRGQVLQTIKALSNKSIDNQIGSVTDGFNDNSIDGIFINKEIKEIYLIQSKWIKSGNSFPKKKDIQSFLKGVKDLVTLKFEKFNDRIKNKQKNILNALKDPEYKIVLVLSYTSNQEISGESSEEVEEFISEMNDGNYEEIFSWKLMKLKDLYNSLLENIDNTPINLKEITLYNWGKQDIPFDSIYGTIEAETLAKIWIENGQNIVNKNLRRFKIKSDINNLIEITLSNDPKYFWYFNNGITVICNHIGKSAVHGNDRTAGVFSFDDVSIINGAQTIGSIGNAYGSYPNQVKEAKVHIRFINLAEADGYFEKKVTRYTNTQNRVENKDFAALDENQNRLKRELLLLKKHYYFRTGEQRTQGENETNIEEATLCLSCLNEDLSLSTLAQRNIGEIWSNIENPPYTILFNDKTDAHLLWRAIEFRRTLNSVLENRDFKLGNEKEDMLITHGDSFLLHKAYEIYGRQKIRSKDPDYSLDTKSIIDIGNSLVDITKETIDKMFPNVFLPTLFKNNTKLERLSTSINDQFGITRDLFNQ